MNAPLAELGTGVIGFDCHHCGGRLTVPVMAAGVEGPCPKCGGLVVSPTLGQELPEGVGEFVPLNRSNLRGTRGVDAEARPRKRDFVAKRKMEVEWEKDESWKDEAKAGARKRSKRRARQNKVRDLVANERLMVVTEVLGVAAIFVIVGAVVFLRLTDWGEQPLFGQRGEAPAHEPRAELMAEVVAGSRPATEENPDSNRAAFERVRTAMEKRWEDGDGRPGEVER